MCSGHTTAGPDGLDEEKDGWGSGGTDLDELDDVGGTDDTGKGRGTAGKGAFRGGEKGRGRGGKGGGRGKKARFGRQ